MAEDKGATPPGGGRMNHDVMRRASELPVEGVPATDTVAASGGLEVPGHVVRPRSDAERADLEDATRETPPTAASVDKLERASRAEDR